jgi:hypothetical protein
LGRKGTSSLTSFTAVLAALGEREHTGTSSLVSGNAVLSVREWAHTGIAPLVSKNAVLVGIGSHGVTGLGTLISFVAVLPSRGRVRYRHRKPRYGAIPVDVIMNRGLASMRECSQVAVSPFR